MLQFYVIDNLWEGRLNTSHFRRLPDAVQAYRALPASSCKALGIQRGVDAIDLVQCLPLFPSDREGEDVMVLRFLEFPLWKSDPQIMELTQELASRLHPRYCLYKQCIIPAPEQDKLPRALRGRYLWPDEPGNFYTAAQWIYVGSTEKVEIGEYMQGNYNIYAKKPCRIRKCAPIRYFNDADHSLVMQYIHAGSTCTPQNRHFCV